MNRRGQRFFLSLILLLIHPIFKGIRASFDEIRVNDELCNDVALLNLGEGRIFYGGGWESWLNYWTHDYYTESKGLECVQFDVTNNEYFDNGLILTGAFDFIRGGVYGSHLRESHSPKL